MFEEKFKGRLRKLRKPKTIGLNLAQSILIEKDDSASIYNQRNFLSQISACFNTMATKKKKMYRIIFHNQSKVYELYARHVSQSDMYAFVEVGDIVFGEQSQLVVNPGEEQLKNQFEGVSRTYIPIHSVIRVDEVEKEGAAKVHTPGEKGVVTPFPVHYKAPEGVSSD